MIPASYDEFVQYLQKKNFQKRIDQLAKKYRGKKMIVYGAGVLSSAIFDNYDLSGLNIIGVADNKFVEPDQEFKGYKAIYPADIPDYDPDVILLATYYSYKLCWFLMEDVLPNSGKIKIKTIVPESLLERIKKIFCELKK